MGSLEEVMNWNSLPGRWKLWRWSEWEWRISGGINHLLQSCWLGVRWAQARGERNWECSQAAVALTVEDWLQWKERTRNIRKETKFLTVLAGWSVYFLNVIFSITYALLLFQWCLCSCIRHYDRCCEYQTGSLTSGWGLLIKKILSRCVVPPYIDCKF